MEEELPGMEEELRQSATGIFLSLTDGNAGGKRQGAWSFARENVPQMRERSTDTGTADSGTFRTQENVPHLGNRSACRKRSAKPKGVQTRWACHMR